MQDLEKDNVVVDDIEVKTEDIKVDDDVVVEEEVVDTTVIEPEKDDSSLIIEVEEPAEANDKKSKKDKKKDKKKSSNDVVEVTNIPSEVVTAKESKKSKKFTSFMSFTVIILALVFSIIDWVLQKVTKDPEIVLHLMDWIVIILYLSLAVKALPFLNGKKKWVKAMFWICVIATLVCIVVPMILDYVDLSKAIEQANASKESAKAIFTYMVA